jgi:hypothetical protein
VDVGPGSALNNMSAGRNPKRGLRYDWKRVGPAAARGLRVDINLGKRDWGNDRRASSIGYRSDNDCASWCASDELMYEVETRRSARWTY